MPTPPTPRLFLPRPARRLATWLAVGLCIGHVFLAASVSRQFCTTFDEIAHVSAGYTYWTRDDLRFQPENGNFPQRWVALPLLAMDLQPVPADDPAFANANVWSLGDELFYRLGNDPAKMLAAARLMIALLSGTLCFVIFCWSRDLFGPLAGLVSVTLAAFSPTLLAHGGLATSDCAAALTFLVATLAWWRLCHRITLGRVLTAGLAAGLLAVAKFSAALFAPMALVLVLFRLAHRAPITVAWWHHRWRFRGLRQWAALVVVAGLAGLLAWGTIWTFYGFRYAPAADAEHTAYMHRWSQLMLDEPPGIRKLVDGQPASLEPANYAPGPVQRIVAVARAHHLLPEAYLHGLLNVDLYSRSRLAFFAGEYRNLGWTSFFPTVFLLKTPLPTLAILLISGFALLLHLRRRGRGYRLLPLVVLAGIYGATVVTSHLNIGHRHLLPLYPIVFILTGAGARWLGRHRAGWALLVSLVLAQIYTSSVARPHYLAYFNALGGGPDQAYRLFVDSSLDWGQDLPGLKTWLDRNAGTQPVFLSYFGSGDPEHEGIHATRVGDALSDNLPRNVPAALSGGIYCISATMFQRVYTGTRGPWNASFEATYAELRRWLAQNQSRTAGAPFNDLAGRTMTTEQVTAELFRYEDLQFGRLCHFLQHRAPDDEVGYSMLIFRLTNEEVDLALNGSLRDLNARIESQLR